MKKLISAFTSIALLAGVAAMPVAAEETYALGDVTMDGKVDTRDVTEICRHYSRVVLQGEQSPLTEEQQYLADVGWKEDDTYSINLLDAIYVLKYYIYYLTYDSEVDPNEFFKQFQKYERG